MAFSDARIEKISATLGRSPDEMRRVLQDLPRGQRGLVTRLATEGSDRQQQARAALEAVLFLNGLDRQNITSQQREEAKRHMAVLRQVRDQEKQSLIAAEMPDMANRRETERLISGLHLGDQNPAVNILYRFPRYLARNTLDAARVVVNLPVNAVEWGVEAVRSLRHIPWLLRKVAPYALEAGLVGGAGYGLGKIL